MNSLAAFLVCLVTVSAAFGYGSFLTRRYRLGVARLQERLDKQRHALTDQLDRARRQVGQLQDELTAARREIDRLAEPTPEPAVPPASPQALAAAKAELARLLADDLPQRLPASGFADTLPSRMFLEEAGVLIR
ncbi:MAG: hypothetical protein KF788_03260 [Piscinibacter sp.]|nr:hypothetical protein [Piscinibacter sp.]